MKKIYALPLAVLLFHFSFFLSPVSAQNTTIYGMTPGGGTNSDGVLYDYNLTSSIPGTLVNFAGTSNGSSPYGGLTPDNATGYLYGMTYSGGTYGMGTLFSYNACAGLNTIINFKSNSVQAHPYGNLVYDTVNGLFYGMASLGGPYNDGVIFSFNPTNNAENIVVTFNGTNGANPHGSLALDPVNGLFYGMTLHGGPDNYGVIFTFDPTTNAETVVFDFSSVGYAYEPYGNLTWDAQDSVFGGMTWGEPAGGGDLFYWNPKTNTWGEYTNFRGIWGETPFGSLTYDPVHKKLFGMTEDYGSGGNIFWYEPTQASWGSVFDFNGTTEGKYPYGSLTWDPYTGLLYGTAQMGGSSDSGVMYSIDPVTNAQTILINFNKANGALPYGELMYDPATNMLYGMTYAGGINNEGVIYKYNISTNTETVLVNFNGTNGANPWGDLAYDPVNGQLYGMTLNGGANGTGAIVMLDTATNTENAVYSFPANSGAETFPYGKLALDPVDGNLYGMSSGGGANNYGALFRFNPATGKDTTLLSFNNNAYPMGAYAESSLTYDTVNGLFYGMTYQGGTANEGVLFSFNPVTGKDSTLVNFTGANGEFPIYTNLTYDPANQLFYGMTESGGTNNSGILFSFSPVTNIETVLYNFDFVTTNGALPYSSLTYDPVDSLIYGVTRNGGTGYWGIIFSYNTSTSTFNLLYNFATASNGTLPYTTLLYNPADSNLYGATYNGGTFNDGTLYKFNPKTNTETVLESFTGTDGQYPNGDLVMITSPKPAISISGNTSLTCPVISTTLTATAPAGSTFYWSTGATTSSITVNLTLTTTYSLSVCNGFYYKDTTVTVTVTSSVNENISSINYVQCNGEADGGATVSVTSGQSPFTYLWMSGNATTASISGVSAGNYTVTVTDANGCANTAIATITQPAALNDSMGSTCATCCNCQGHAGDSAFGGTPPYTYLWAPGGQTTDTITGLSGGSYTCTVTDAHGCTKTDTVWVTHGEHITPSSTSVSCYGGDNGTATAEVIPGFDYLWTPGGQTNATATGLSAGTYSVTVTNQDTAGCTATLVFTILQPPQLNVSANVVSSPACNGDATGSAIASASGGTPGYNYSWSPSGGNGALAAGLSAGTYVVTATDANGCTGQTSVTITEPAPLTGSITVWGYDPWGDCADTFCYSLNTFVSGGTPPYNYSYIPFGPLCETSYGPSYVSDANGCQLTLNWEVFVGLSTHVVINNNVTCYGGNNGSASVDINTGGPFCNYSWSPGGGTNATASNLSAGTYTVTTTDQQTACTSVKVITITQPPLLSITSTVVPAACSSPGSATASCSNGYAPYTYLWSSGGGTNATATGLIAGTYTVTVTDNHGCSNTALAIVTGSGLNILPSVVNYVSCRGGSNGSASVTVSGGASPYTYSWSNSQTTTSISGLTAGVYTITVTDANSCIGSATINVTQPNQLTAMVTTTANENCYGESNGTANATVSGGTSPYTYTWSNGQTTSNASGLSAGSYSVTVFDSCGSNSIATGLITQPTQIIINMVVGANVSCYGGNTGIIGSGVGGGTYPYTFSWSPPEGTNQSATGLTAGTYTLNVVDINGCTGSAAATITQPNQLSVSANTINNVSCYNGNNGNASSTISGGTSPYTYLWSNGQTTSNSSGLSAGTYMVTVSDSCGASATASTVITQPAALVMTGDSINDNGSCNGAAWVTINGGVNPYTYLWTGGATTDSIYNQCNGNYCCVITDANGCLDSVCVTINLSTGVSQVKGESGKVKVYPNPNNGNFTITNYELGITNVEIYDVLGQRVFFSNYSLSINHYSLDLSDKPSGVYLYRVLREDGSLIGEGKLIIDK